MHICKTESANKIGIPLPTCGFHFQFADSAYSYGIRLQCTDCTFWHRNGAQTYEEKLWKTIIDGQIMSKTYVTKERKGIQNQNLSSKICGKVIKNYHCKQDIGQKLIISEQKSTFIDLNLF